MIRPFGLRDVLMVRQLQPQNVAFDLRRLLLYSPSSVRSALAGYLTHHHLGTITCVHENREQQRGFIQVWPRRDRPEWELAFLAPSLDEHKYAPDLWYRLLTHTIIMAAEEGNLRIYARSPEDAEAEDIFRQAGFTVLSREEVFVLSHGPSPAPLPKGLRRSTPHDRWALEELYHQVVPQIMQQAEGLITQWGTMRSFMPSQLAPSNRGYLWTEKGRVIAYLGLCTSSRGHWLEILVRPEYRADLLPYIKYMLTLTRSAPDRPVYVPVPDSSVGLGWLLRTLSFESYARQVLLAAYTVACAPIRRHMVVPALKGSIDIGSPVGYGYQLPPDSKASGSK